jgi:hypothetical protein
MTRPCSTAPLTVGGQRLPDDLVVKVADLSGAGDEGRQASARTDKAVCDRSPAASVTPNASTPVTCRGPAGSIRTQDSLGSRVVTGPGARASTQAPTCRSRRIRSGQPALRSGHRTLRAHRNRSISLPVPGASSSLPVPGASRTTPSGAGPHPEADSTGRNSGGRRGGVGRISVELPSCAAQRDEDARWVLAFPARR